MNDLYSDDATYQRDLARATEWLETHDEGLDAPNSPDPFQLDWKWLDVRRAYGIKPREMVLPHPKLRMLRRPWVVAGLVSACLLLSVVTLFRDDEPRSIQKLSVVQVVGRGRDARSLRIADSSEGFVSAVGSTEGGQLVVMPLYDGADVILRDQQLSSDILLPVNVQHVVVIITQTPSLFQIGREFDSKPVDGRDKVLKEQVAEYLKKHGYQRFAIGEISLGRGEQ